MNLAGARVYFDNLSVIQEILPVRRDPLRPAPFDSSRVMDFWGSPNCRYGALIIA